MDELKEFLLWRKKGLERRKAYIKFLPISQERQERIGRDCWSRLKELKRIIRKINTVGLKAMIAKEKRSYHLNRIENTCKILRKNNKLGLCNKTTFLYMGDTINIYDENVAGWWGKDKF